MARMSASSGSAVIVPTDAAAKKTWFLNYARTNPEALPKPRFQCLFDDNIGTRQFFTFASGGTSTSGTADANSSGVDNYATGAGATNFIRSWSSNFLFASGLVYARFRVRVSAVSDGTDTYTLRLGLMDSIFGAGNPSSGAYFRYTHSVNSGNWIAVTRSGGGAENVVNASAAPAVAGTNWQDLEVLYDPNGAAVEFYIAQTLISGGRVTTAVPTSAQPVQLSAMIEKSLGTTDRSLLIDIQSLIVEVTGVTPAR